MAHTISLQTAILSFRAAVLPQNRHLRVFALGRAREKLVNAVLQRETFTKPHFQPQPVPLQKVQIRSGLSQD